MKTLTLIAVVAALSMAGCADKKTAAEKVADNVSSSAYVLTPEDRGRAEANAKSHFNKEWVIAGGQRGQFNLCKPTDSNENGMVSCYGYVPKPDGTFKEDLVYCGYDGKIGGCSSDDLKVGQ